MRRIEGDKTKSNKIEEKKGKKKIEVLILNMPNGAQVWQSTCQMEFPGANGM